MFIRLQLCLLSFVWSLSAQPVSFQKDISPILSARCVACHQAQNGGGGLSLHQHAALVKGGNSGTAILAGKPDESLLIREISGPTPKMPKFGAPLTPEQVALIRKWVEEGAKDDSGGAAEEVWWSLRPLQKPEVPKLSSAWGRTPIDAFIFKKLKKNQLVPSPEADRRTLIRRVYFDLHGLAPDPTEVEHFIHDPSPDAYEKMVNRLLASPRYGERWARHWLDVIHYGDSHGYDKDKPRLNAWPYRDYVIKAFNEDKPYQQFIREQIAGDILYPDNPNAFVATGFIAAGPWDFVGHQELKEGSTDKELTRVLDRDDMVAQTISTFTSMTAHCARCHDHKFDPISQKDYYNLQAVFAGVDRTDRPYDLDAEMHQQRQQIMEKKRAVQLRIQPYLDQVEFASSPEIDALTDSIQDAGLQIAHIGEPKTAADAEKKKELEARRRVDREKKQKLVDAMVGQEAYQKIEHFKRQLLAVDAELAELPKPQYVYSASNFFTRAGAFRPSLNPRPVHVLNRGSVQDKGELAVPAALRSVPGLPGSFDLVDSNDEGARRAELAQWISDSRNVLTWRSIVNRIWHYHFGAGIVDSPSDFGRMGNLPSHPELLDWLAVWFRDETGGSLKQLHRMIVTSSVYRQSSKSNAEGEKKDSGNQLLWRMNRMRIDAEAVRDTVLQISGKLDLKMGGPAVQMFHFKDDHSPVYDYSRFDPDDPGGYRRSIYRFIVRSVPDPFMERLDCPDPSVLTPKRTVTLTAIQALAMMNNPFMVQMSEHLANRVKQESTDPVIQVKRASILALGREPSSEEMSLYREYVQQHGMTNFARLLMNTNEFLFVD